MAYIDRSELNAKIEEEAYLTKSAKSAFKRIVYNTSAADVSPVRHGRWEYYDTYMDGITVFTCSCCGDKQNGRHGWSWKKNFCPNCGAKMDLEDSHDSDGI